MSTYAERVDALMTYLLFTKEELSEKKSPSRIVIEPKDIGKVTLPEGGVLVEGIARGYGFSSARVEEKKEEIRQLVKEVVADEFLATGGGGMSFLQLVNDRDGNLWTGSHLVAEGLFCLAKAARMADFVMPRHFWSAMPGGVPYLVFNP